MTAVMIEAVSIAALTVWAGCTLLILISDLLNPPRTRSRALAVRCGRPVHRWVPILQAALFTTSALQDRAGAWWVDIGWSVLVVLVWLTICRIGIYSHPDASRPDPWSVRLAGHIWYLHTQHRHRTRPPHIALDQGPDQGPGCGELPEETPTHFGEALAAMTVVLDVATRCRRRQAKADNTASGHTISGDALLGDVVDDPQLVVAWRHTSCPARVDLLASMACYAVIVGVTAADLPPGSPAHDLLIHALAGQDTSQPDGPLFGPGALHMTAHAEALLADSTIADRDKRAVCGQLALALLSRGHQP